LAANRAVSELLKDRFTASRSVDSLVKHFKAGVDEYHKGEWEKSLAKGGKFIEAVLKVVLVEASLPAQSGRQFKVDKAINDLAGLPSGGVDESIRLTIPRCCRFVYEVTSNRGGRHDPDEIDANEMDATAILANSAWVLSEMVRYAQRQRDPAEAMAAVDDLMKRRYPFVEEIDGRVYVDLKSAKSARDLGLLILWQRGTRRMNREELIQSVHRQRRSVTLANARTAVSRLSDVVDDDGQGNLRLRNAGFREADELIAQIDKTPVRRRKRSKRRINRTAAGRV
jgi:hypothetical protein